MVTPLEKLVQRTLAPVADATLVSGAYASTNFGSSTNLQIGNLHVSGNDFAQRSLARYDLSQIPPAARITRAELVLTRTGDSVVPSPLTCHAQRVTAAWVEAQVTHATRDGVVPWTTPGGDVAGDIVQPFVALPAEPTTRVDLRVLASDAIAHRGGVLDVRLAGPLGGGASRFLDVPSREGGGMLLELEYYVPVPAAAGPITVPMQALAEMLASRPVSLERLGADPLARIHYPAIADEQIPLILPGIVLAEGDRWNLTRKSGGARNYLRPSGSILVLFCAMSRYPADLEAGRRDFSNWIGQTLAELAEIAGDNDHLAIDGVRQEMPPALCSEEHERSIGQYFLASYYVDWS